jgi:hypothetical protein
MLKIGLLFSSMDRYELMCMALHSVLEGIDPERYAVTILWQDGSLEHDGKRFFESFESERARIIKHGGVRGIGAAKAIERGMKELLDLDDFDWLGTVESDVYLKPNWLRDLFIAHDAAKAAGFNPGILTPYVIHGWVVEYHERFVIMSNVGAACSLFKPGAWQLVPPVEIGHLFPMQIRSEFGHPVGHNRDRSAARRSLMGYDWSFSASVYHGGFDSVGTRPTCLYNCGVPEGTKRSIRGYSYLEKGDSPTWAGEGPVTLGPRNYAGWIAALRTEGPVPLRSRVRNLLPEQALHRLRALRSVLTGR